MLFWLAPVASVLVIAVVVGIIASYLFASGFDFTNVGLATDAPDSLGNTIAATGKGFAIGSAMLTGLALLASYVEELRMGLTVAWSIF